VTFKNKNEIIKQPWEGEKGHMTLENKKKRKNEIKFAKKVT